MGAEAHNIDLSHSGREHSEKTKGEQGGPGSRPTCAQFQVSVWTLKRSAITLGASIVIRDAMKGIHNEEGF
jgi:hypothetical protein